MIERFHSKRNVKESLKMKKKTVRWSSEIKSHTKQIIILSETTKPKTRKSELSVQQFEELKATSENANTEMNN